MFVKIDKKRGRNGGAPEWYSLQNPRGNTYKVPVTDVEVVLEEQQDQPHRTSLIE